MAPRLALLLREGPLTALLAAMQEGNMVNAISETFKSAKADLEISWMGKCKRKIDSRISSEQKYG